MILYISHSKRTINLKVFYEFGHLFVHFCFWFQPNWHFQSVTTSDSLMNWRNAPKTYFIWFRLIVLDNFACRSLNAKLFFTAFFCQKSKKKKKKEKRKKKTITPSSVCACAIIMVPYLTDLSRVYSVVGVGWSHNNWFYEHVSNLKVFRFVMGRATRLMLLKVCERADYDVIHAKSKLLGVGNSDECEFGKRSEINSWG